MTNFRFLQFDVFTDHAFAGNPLAVFPEAEGISDERMMQIAREMNLSETVFVLQPDGGDDRVLRRLRIFTPAREIPFAGHPIGASRAHARFFAPADNIPEDPATGSACGALGGYLVYHGGLTLEPEDGRYRFVIEQGDFIHRPSRINLDVKGEKGRVEEVKVGGPSVLVAGGEVMF